MGHIFLQLKNWTLDNDLAEIKKQAYRVVVLHYSNKTYGGREKLPSFNGMQN